MQKRAYEATKAHFREKKKKKKKKESCLVKYCESIFEVPNA
jgi:hypothetical protein